MDYHQTEHNRQETPATWKHGAAPAEGERLTASELANLWVSYLDNDLKAKVVEYLARVAEDKEIKQLLEDALEHARNHLRVITRIYEKMRCPLPQALSGADVDLHSPRLFTDEFALIILENIAESRIEGYGTALGMATSPDILDFFYQAQKEPAAILTKTIRLALARDYFLIPPQIPAPEKGFRTKSQNFITGLLSRPRPLTAIEISHVFVGLKKNSYRRIYLDGFSRTAEHKDVRRYLERGRDIAAKHLDIFSRILAQNNLPAAPYPDAVLAGPQARPFSDRLMMQYVSVSNVINANDYGKALTVVGTSPKLGIDFARLQMEILTYARDGMNIVIRRGWFEEPPQAASAAKGVLH